MSSIVITHPEVVKQWHPTKNGELKPDMFTYGSKKKVWWLCDKKCPEGCLHEWETDISHRICSNRGCPFCCKNPRILCEHMSINYTHPEIVKQWHNLKNGELKPENFSYGSGKKFWWLCDKKCPEGCLHEWECTVLGRCGTIKSGCPFCSEPCKKLCEHMSIKYTHPDIAKQWHPIKNGDLKPENFTYGTGKIIWWLCDKKCPEGCLHEWETSILSRCGNIKSGCPFCCNSPQQICIHNSISITHPEIAKQWHPTLNDGLKPESFSHGSGKKVWWICKYNHFWETSILHRCHKKGCPFCKNKTEEKLRIYLNKKLFNPISQFKTEWCKYQESDSYFRFDFLIKEMNLIIELDGEQHFSQVSNWNPPEIVQDKDIYKMKKALANLYSIIRIKQQDVWDMNDLELDKKLLPNIKNYDIPCIIFIEEDDTYKKHKNLMLSDINKI